MLGSVDLDIIPSSEHQDSHIEHAPGNKYIKFLF